MLCLDMRRVVREVSTANGYGLVVMTLASHARGRGFDPLFPYAFLPQAGRKLALFREIDVTTALICLDQAEDNWEVSG